MLQKTAYLHHIIKLYVSITVRVILVLLMLFVKKSALPKNLTYGLAREAVKKEIEFRTINWSSLKYEQFLVRYKEQDTDNVKLMLEAIKVDYQQVNEILTFTNNVKVPIIIYPDSPSLGRSFGWDADQSAMGVYWAGVIRIVSPKEWLGDLSRGDKMEVFRKKGPMIHEYVHLVVDYRTHGNYTRWFTEGIAQLVEKKITGFQFQSTALKIDSSKWYDLADMDKDFDNLPNQSLAYSQSLVMVQYLVDEYGYEGLNAILDYLGKSKTLNETFQIVIGKTLEQFLETCKNFINAGTERH